MSRMKVAIASFTRPANTTQYAAGDIVANNATAGSVVVPGLEVSPIPGATGSIKRVHLQKSSATLTAAAFSVLLFHAAPVITSGDNAAAAIAGGAAGYIGKVAVTVDQAFADGAVGVATCDLAFDLLDGSKKLYAVIVATDTYTPVSAEVITITLDVERD